MNLELPNNLSRVGSNSSDISSWLTRADGDAPLSSNQHAIEIPFQRWFKFKEAFSPQLVADCLNRLPRRPMSLLDPFGGCGTSGLASQFLGIKPTLIEVNPFIADLAEAKLSRYKLNALEADFHKVRKMAHASKLREPRNHFNSGPLTLCEPGDGERWLFPKDTLARIIAYRNAIERLDQKSHRKLLKVLLGSVLVPCSNAVVNGKGRRYRRNWESTQSTPDDVDKQFLKVFLSAFGDLLRFNERPEHRFRLLRGSCLDRIVDIAEIDAAIFSPPYPNSFDYTDIYNIELWTLGYLNEWTDNRQLRQATLRSHVQVEFNRKLNVPLTPTLMKITEELRACRSLLWNRGLPEMVEGYFADLSKLLGLLRGRLTAGGGVFMIVGDSRYNNTLIPVASILSEIATHLNYTVRSVEHLRQMRTSAQSGGTRQLNESLVWLEKPAQ